MLTNQMRKSEVIRVVQAVSAGTQAFMSFLGVSDALPPKVVLFVMAGVAGVQVAVSVWNSGLHNEPNPNPEYTSKP